MSDYASLFLLKSGRGPRQTEVLTCTLYTRNRKYSAKSWSRRREAFADDGRRGTRIAIVERAPTFSPVTPDCTGYVVDTPHEKTIRGDFGERRRASEF